MQPFRLDSVLNYRKQLADNAQLQLAQVLEEEARLLEEIDLSRAGLSGLYNALDSRRREGTTVDTLILYENRIGVLQEHLALLEDKRLVLQQQVARKRRELLRASQDKRILEKLKHQQNLSHHRYLEKKEAVMLDEIAILFHKK